MKIDCKVSHLLQQPMAYASGPTTFPNLRARLILDGDMITQVDHEVMEDDLQTNHQIAETSKQQLSILWEVINYISGHDLRRADCRVERLGNASSPNSPSTTSRNQTGTARIVRPLKLPDETRLLSNNRLRVWLRLANDARLPASSIDAIRNYYMIVEDMLGPETPGTSEQELKFTRNFVSHGVALDRRALLEFLEREIGAGTQQYDPFNPSHQRFVEKRRDWAMRLVESKINSRLNI
jgi:hypothetical protein